MWAAIVATARADPQRAAAMAARFDGDLSELIDLLTAGAEGAEWEQDVRLNEFAARLGLLSLGLRTISAALEKFDTGPANLAAAVLWFEYAGPSLLAATLHGRTYVGEETGFSVPRWTFWRSRLERLAQEGDEMAREGFRNVKRYDRRIAGRITGE